MSIVEITLRYSKCRKNNVCSITQRVYPATRAPQILKCFAYCTSQFFNVLPTKRYNVLPPGFFNKILMVNINILFTYGVLLLGKLSPSQASNSSIGFSMQPRASLSIKKENQRSRNSSLIFFHCEFQCHVLFKRAWVLTERMDNYEILDQCAVESSEKTVAIFFWN